ncbi:MAG: hypothetical protein FWD23_07270 [Oscillospiraceae bacterium]|nr:hypothetical protein [Oscillospiraceae bacterium]
MWINPITDRALSDVQYARDNPGLSANLKGALNISDLNRISGNLIWIGENIAIYKYPDKIIPPEWVRTDFFKYPDMSNYEANVYYIRDYYSLVEMFPAEDFGQREIFGVYSRKKINYIKVNQWERIMMILYKFVVLSPNTWKSVLDGHTSWQNVKDVNARWGDLLL